MYKLGKSRHTVHWFEDENIHQISVSWLAYYYKKRTWSVYVFSSFNSNAQGMKMMSFWALTSQFCDVNAALETEHVMCCLVFLRSIEKWVLTLGFEGVEVLAEGLARALLLKNAEVAMFLDLSLLLLLFPYSHYNLGADNVKYIYTSGPKSNIYIFFRSVIVRRYTYTSTIKPCVFFLLFWLKCRTNSTNHSST